MIYMYILTAILWGTFATRMHIELKYKSTMYICFILNSIFWPIAICMAIKNVPLKEKK